MDCPRNLAVETRSYRVRHPIDIGFGAGFAFYCTREMRNSRDQLGSCRLVMNPGVFVGNAG